MHGGQQELQAYEIATNDPAGRCFAHRPPKPARRSLATARPAHFGTAANLETAYPASVGTRISATIGCPSLPATSTSITMTRQFRSDTGTRLTIARQTHPCTGKRPTLTRHSQACTCRSNEKTSILHKMHGFAAKTASTPQNPATPSEFIRVDPWKKILKPRLPASAFAANRVQSRFNFSDTEKNKGNTKGKTT